MRFIDRNLEQQLCPGKPYLIPHLIDRRVENIVAVLPGELEGRAEEEWTDNDRVFGCAAGNGGSSGRIGNAFLRDQRP